MVTYRDPGLMEFDAILQRSETSGSSAFVVFPFEVVDVYGVRGRVPVVATFDGLPYRGSLVTYGGAHMILVLTSIREALGKTTGDTVTVRVELDTAERVVELADDEQRALEEAGQLDAYRAMSYSHQREYHLWVEDAKRPETRARRITSMVERVAAGQRLK